MNMWNWLLACYNERSLTLKDLESVMENDRVADMLWDDFVVDSGDFIDWVREEVKPFIEYVKQKENTGKQNE